MEKEESDNMDGKGVRNRPKLTIVHGKGVFPKKKDSDLAQIVVHKSSSSSVQENESAPVLPDSVDHNKKNLEETSDTNVSISRTVAEHGVLPPPQVEEGTSAFGGHATVVLYDFFGKEESSKKKDSDSNQIIVTNESSPSSIQENVTDPVASSNQRSSECRIVYRCRYCATSCINYKSFVRHEKRHRDYEPDNRPTVSTQYNNSSARYTTPKKPRSKLLQSGQPTLGFDRRQGTNSSVSFSEIRELQGVNDGSIDLLSRVGASINSSLENHDDDGKHDQDQEQDHNNHEDDDGTFDLLSRVGRKPT